MAKGFITLPVGYQRVDAEPLTNDQVFQSLEEAQAFANGTSDKGNIAYAGQVISVLMGGTMKCCVIQSDKSISVMDSDKSWETWE